MMLVKLIKGLIHVRAKNGDLQYSFWSAGDYKIEEEAEIRENEWCSKMNKEAGYTKYTFETVKLYGEATKW